MILTLPRISRRRNYDEIGRTGFMLINLRNAAAASVVSACLILIMNLVAGIAHHQTIQFSSPIHIGLIGWVYVGYILAALYLWWKVAGTDRHARIFDLEAQALQTRTIHLAAFIIGVLTFYMVGILTGVTSAYDMHHPSFEIAAGIALFAHGFHLGVIYNRGLVV